MHAIHYETHMLMFVELKIVNNTEIIYHINTATHNYKR